MSNIVISIRNVTLELANEAVLKNVSHDFESGKIHGIVGKNGSGKTVLMKCICGFLCPTSGGIHVNGSKIGDQTDFPDDVGIIIEVPGFLPHYSGLKNLLMLASIRHKIKKEDICRAMELVGLNPRLKKSVSKYSLGMRQRLGIAQAIMENPSLLILDEPMNSLDKYAIDDVRKLLLSLRDQGKTILLSSHSMDDISILCDTLCEMEDGVLSVKKTTLQQ